MARPHWHLLASLPPAALAGWQAGPVTAVALAASAVLIDADRAADWLAGGGHVQYEGRTLRPLHSWELIVAILLAARLVRGRRLANALAAIGAGFTSHLALDELVYQPLPLADFLLLGRARRRFGPQSVWPRRRAPLAWELASAALASGLALFLGEGWRGVE